MGDAAGGAVALHTGLLGGEHDLGGVAAVRHVVALGAGADGVLGVVEVAARQPAVGDDGFGHERQGVGTGGFYLVAIGATGETGATGRAGTGGGGEGFGGIGGEENLLFEVLTGEGEVAEAADLRADKIIHLGLGGGAAAAGEVGVLGGQAVEESAHAGGVAVGELQLGIVGVELQRVAARAVFVESKRLEVRAGDVGLVAVGAGEFLTVEFGEIFAEVKLVVEAEGVGFAQLLLVDLELGMVGGERVKDGAVAGHGARGFEEEAAFEFAVVEDGGGEGFSFFGGGLHHCGRAVAGEALAIFGGQHAAFALVLAVTGGARVVADDVGLMEFVVGVAAETGVVDAGHFADGDLVQAVRFERPGAGSEGEMDPGADIARAGEVTGRAAFTAAAGVLGGGEGEAVVIGGNGSGGDELPAPRSEETDQEKRHGRGEHEDAELAAAIAQAALGLAFRNRAGAAAGRLGAGGARAAVLVRAGATPAAFFFARFFFQHGTALEGRAAGAGSGGADTAGLALARPAADPVLIGPLVLATVEVGGWELVLHGRRSKMLGTKSAFVFAAAWPRRRNR